MFKSSNFIIAPSSTDLNLKIRDEFNNVTNILKASSICRFHKDGDTIVINSSDSTSAIYLKFYSTDESTLGINILYNAWQILKANYLGQEANKAYVDSQLFIVDARLDILESSHSTSGLLINVGNGLIKTGLSTISLDITDYETDDTIGLSSTSGILFNAASSTSGYVSIVMNTNNFQIIDGRNTKTGIQYANDYSSTYTNRSLVDKAYVDNKLASSITFTPAGDVTGSTSGITSLTPVLTIGTNVVTFSKIQQINAFSLIGNTTGSTANLTNITLGSGFSFVGTTLDYTPSINIAGTSGYAILAGTAGFAIVAGTVITNANLSGDITSIGNITSYNNIVPISKGGTPTGGTSGQFLQKNSSTNYDYSWVNLYYQTVQVLSTSGTARAKLNFSGQFSHTDDSTNNSTDITISSVNWILIAGTPTTIAGYGISDGVTLTGTQALSNKTGNISQWTNDSGYLLNNKTITLSGDVTGSGTSGIVTSISNTIITGKLLTGYASTTGVITANDSILSSIEKLNGNIGTLVTGVSTFNTRSGNITLTSSDVTTALTFTPYNATNPSGYLINNQTIILSGDVSGSGTSGIITSVNWVNGYPTYDARYVTPSSTNTFTNKSGNISQWTNDSGYITSASGTAGGDLNGTYPNPTVNWVNGYPTYDARYAEKSGVTFTGAVILSADPVVALGAATKNYVDNLVTGLSWKNSVQIATVSNITLSGEQNIDNVITSNSRVLVKNQTTQTQNGIYVSSTSGWSRSSDMNIGSEIFGATVYVETGNINANTQWSNNNTSGITVGVSNINFVQIAGAGTYTNGTGIVLTGNVFSIDSSYTATSGRTGYLSSSDWTVFNNKQAALNGTGLVKFTGTTPSYITGASSQFVKADGSLDSNSYLINNQIITLSGDVSGSGTSGITTSVTWSNGYSTYDLRYVTPSSTNTLTNKTGNISQWTNDNGYLINNKTITLSGDVSGSGTSGIVTSVNWPNGYPTYDSRYVTPSSTNTFTNKTGNISQWTNDAGYLTNDKPITLSGDVSGSGTSGIITTVNWSNGYSTYDARYVASVSGTSGRITSTGGVNPMIDISASYIGQPSITTLGTIISGIWNGTAITDGNLASSYIYANGSRALTNNWASGSFYISAGQLGAGTGTTTPSSMLHIVETSSSPTRGILSDQYTTSTIGSRITMRKARGTFALPNVIVSGDVLGSFTASGYDGTNFIDSGKILITSTGTISSGTIPASLTLQTMNSSGVLTAGITIDQSQIVTFASHLVVEGVTSTGATGTGNFVFSNSPIFTTPNIGIATGNITGTAGYATLAITNANLTGPITSVGNTTFVASQTGTGTTFVMNTSPVLVTPTLGVASATTINKVTLTTPATGSTLTIADGKTLTVSNTLTFTGTDNSSVAFGTGGTATYTSNNLSVFAATTSAQLAGVLSDETGTGFVVFSDSPVFTTQAIIPTLYGSASSSGNLQLNSTTNASKGFIYIGSAVGYDATKNFLGIGTQTPAALVHLSGNISAASWALNGIGIRDQAATYTDTTIATGTTPNVYMNYYGVKTMNSSNTSVVVTNLFGSYFENPIATGNVTATNSYAAGFGGNVRFVSGAGQTQFTFSNGLTINMSSAQTFAVQMNGTSKYVISTLGNHTFTGTTQSSGIIPFITFTQSAYTGGATPGLLWTAGAHTGQTSATEINDALFNLARSVTWVTSIPTTQRFFRITAPTINCILASTTVTAATFSISGAPGTAGSAGITNPLSLWVESGASAFNGSVGINQSTVATSTLQVSGSLSVAYTVQTTTYSILPTDHSVNCTSGTFTATLPTAVGATGRIYIIKNSGTGVITIATTSAQTIDGSSTKTLSVQYSGVTVQSTGSNWIVIGTF
jgi:hypothetical protein